VISSKFPLKAAVVLAITLSLAASSAFAQPMDQGPIVRSPATADVYVPPAALWQQQDASPPQWPAHPQALPVPSTVRADDGVSPWMEAGLAAGGFVLLAGGVVALRRTRRRRTAA
jgi:hypothetical protein